MTRDFFIDLAEKAARIDCKWNLESGVFESFRIYTCGGFFYIELTSCYNIYRSRACLLGLSILDVFNMNLVCEDFKTNKELNKCRYEKFLDMRVVVKIVEVNQKDGVYQYTVELFEMCAKKFKLVWKWSIYGERWPKYVRRKFVKRFFRWFSKIEKSGWSKWDNEIWKNLRLHRFLFPKNHIKINLYRTWRAKI